MDPKYEMTPSEYAAAVAVVHIESDGSAKLEVGIGERGNAAWEQQPLHFRNEDPLEERYRTIGFLLASMATAKLRESKEAEEGAPSEGTLPDGAPPAEEETSKGTPAGENEPSTQTESETSSLSPASKQENEKNEVRPTTLPESAPAPESAALGARSERVSRLRLNAMVAGQMGLGLIGEGDVRTSLQGGPLVRVGVSLPRIPILVDLTVGWSTAPQRSERLSLSWTRFDASVAYRFFFAGSRVALRPLGLVFVENLSARAESDSSSAFERQGHWSVGVGAGGGVSYQFVDSWTLEIEAVFLRIPRRIGIEVDGTRLGFVPAWNYRSLLGVSYTF